MTVIPRAVEARRALGHRLAVERMIRDLTQDRVAEHIGARQGLISVVETGRRDPYLGTFIAVAEAVGLQVALVAEHHLAWLDLTEAELTAIHVAADAFPGGSVLQSALRKLADHCGLAS